MSWNPRPFGKAALACLTFIVLLSSSALATDSADMKEVGTYPLTMDKVRRLAAAATELSAYGESHPNQSTAKSGSGDSNFTEMAKELDSKSPEAAAIIKKHGYSTREFMVASTTLGMASMAVNLKKSGMSGGATAKEEGPVVKANEELLEKNWDEVQRLSAAMRPAKKGN